MEQVHIVFASTGEWSDRSEWPLIAYTDEDVAKLHVEAADVLERQREIEFDAAMDKYTETARTAGVADADDDYPGYFERKIFFIRSVYVCSDASPRYALPEASDA